MKESKNEADMYVQTWEYLQDMVLDKILKISCRMINATATSHVKIIIIYVYLDKRVQINFKSFRKIHAKMIAIVTLEVGLKEVKRDFNLICNIQFLKFTMEMYLCISCAVNINV